SALADLKRAVRHLRRFPPTDIKTPYHPFDSLTVRTGCRERWMFDLEETLDDLEQTADRFLAATLSIPLVLGRRLTSEEASEQNRKVGVANRIRNEELTHRIGHRLFRLGQAIDNRPKRPTPSTPPVEPTSSPDAPGVSPRVDGGEEESAEPSLQLRGGMWHFRYEGEEGYYPVRGNKCI